MANGSITQLYNEGLRQANKRNWRKAVEALKNVVAQDSKHVNSYNALGMIHMQQGNNMAARRYWHKALRIDPDNVTARQCLAALDMRAPEFCTRKLLVSLPLAIMLLALIGSNTYWLHYTSKLKNDFWDLKAMVRGIQDTETKQRNRLEQGDQRLQDVEMAANTSSSVAEPPAVIKQPAVVESPVVTEAPVVTKAPSITELQISEIYDEALADCMSRRYESSVMKFQQILNYPLPHSLKDNAQYWIANCYYAQGKYDQALTEFKKVRELYPKENKVFDSELMVAYTYCRLGRLDKARQKSLQLSRDFPGEAYQSHIGTLSEKIRAVEAQGIKKEDERDTAEELEDVSDEYAYYGYANLLSKHREQPW